MPSAAARDDVETIAAPDSGESDHGAPSPLLSAPPERERRRPPLLGDVRTRVLISFLILLVVSTAASLLVLREVLFSRIGTEVQERLAEQVDNLRLLAIEDDFDGDLERIFTAYLRRESPLEDGGLTAFIEGQEVASVPVGLFAGEFGSLATIDEPTSGELTSPSGPLRFVAVPVNGEPASGVMVAAKLLNDDRDRVESAVRIAAGVSIVITLLASLFIWLAAGRAVQPLRALARTTRTITETDLTDRVQVRGESEIADLGRTFNGMLDRLQSAFADQKEFLADVGHELRTPITVIRGHLETLGDDPVERHEATAVIHDELERMSRLVDDLLLLARSDRPDFLRVEPLDLDVLTQEIFAKARTLGVRRWLLDEVAVGLIHADPYRLTSAMTNLAANAVRYTTGDEAIAIGSSLRDGVVRLWVRDEGRGIERHEQERIFERFASGGKAAPGPWGGPRARDREGHRRSPRRTHRARVRGRQRFAVHDRVSQRRAAAAGGRGMARILIAEDEPRLAAFLEKGLRSSGFTTTVVGDGPGAATLALDTRLRADDPRPRTARQGRPRGAARAARRRPSAAGDHPHRPRRHERPDRRPRGRRRRLHRQAVPVRGAASRGCEPACGSARGPSEGRHVIAVGDVTLDLRTRWVSTGDANIELSAREFELLRTFLEHPNQVLSREQLLAHVWGYDYDPGSNVVDVYVGYLRRKLGPESFETVRGVGYRYRA